MPSNPLTQEEINDYSIGRILSPPGYTGLSPYLPEGYFLSTPASGDGPALWRLFDASFISSGTIDPNRLGAGSIGLGNLYLADDGTWKAISIPATPTLHQVTTAGNTTTNAITVGAINAGGDITLANNQGIVLQTTVTTGSNFKLIAAGYSGANNFALGSFYPSSGTNVGQALQVVPRGTGYSSGIRSQIAVFNTDVIADNANYEFAIYRAAGTAFTLATGKVGTGTIRPFLLSAGFTDGTTNANQLWLYTSGNVGINTTTDAGYRLDVNGTARIQGVTTIYDQLTILRSTLLTDVFSVYSSTNSGITTPGRGQFILQHGGTEVFRAYSSRLSLASLPVQIGTNSTDVAMLQVTGSRTASSAIARGVYFNNTLVAAANNDVLVGLDINPTFTNGAFTGVKNVAIRTQTGDVYLVTTSGNVGIGTSSPAAKLHVNGEMRINAGQAIIIDVANGIYFVAASNQFRMYSGGIAALSIPTNGNVLIGTTTDAGYKLDVNGTARIQGLLAVNQVQSSGSISGASYFDVYGVGPAFRLYDNTYSTLYGGIGTYRWATGTAGNDTTILSNTGLGINFIVNGGTTPKATLTSNGTFLVGATTAGYDASLGYMIGAKSNTTQSLISFATSTQTLGAQGMIVGLDGYTGYVWMRSGINLSFGTNDIHRMQITGGGNVLINTTTNAGYKLDVNGSSRIQERLTITGNSGFDNPLTIITDKGGEYGTVYVGNTTNTGTSLVILHNNVGGQYSYNSYAFMGVAGNAYSYSTFGVNASNKFVLGAGGASNLGMYIGTVSAQPLVFNTNNAEVARFVSGGNFLIGTATDTGEKLQVNGTVRASAFSIGATAGWTGTINIPTNPPGQQNIDVQGGIITNVS